jgi:excisionase family DNA binding protein
MQVNAAKAFEANTNTRPNAGGNGARLLDVKETAVRLRLSPSGVYKLIESGRLPALTLGGGKRPHIRVDEAELEAWLYGEGR